jgi:DNA primase
MTFIKSWANSLAERFVIIAYDNDDAGRLGAGKVARVLKDAGGHGKIITVGEPGDDVGSLWQRWPK